MMIMNEKWSELLPYCWDESESNFLLNFIFGIHETNINIFSVVNALFGCYWKKPLHGCDHRDRTEELKSSYE